MVEIGQNVVRFEVRKDATADDVFEIFAGDEGERDRSVFRGEIAITFLEGARDVG